MQSYQVDQQEEYYLEFGQDKQHLPGFLQVELNAVFDYLMRMTADYELSMRVVKDAYQSFINTPGLPSSYHEFRLKLYSDARKQVKMAFYKDTSELIPSIVSHDKDSSFSPPTREDLRATEVLGSLVEKEREVLILAIRCKFGARLLSQVINESETEVENLYQLGISSFCRKFQTTEPIHCIASAAVFSPFSDVDPTPTRIRLILSGMDHQRSFSIRTLFLLTVLGALSSYILPSHVWLVIKSQIWIKFMNFVEKFLL